MSIQGFEEDRIKVYREFERLLSKVSAKYINLPVDLIEQTAQHDFGELARLLGADGCRLHFFDQDRQDWMRFDAVEAAFIWEGPRFTGRFEALRSHPDFFRSMQHVFGCWNRGEPFEYNGADDPLPDTEGLRKLVSVFGVTSFVSVPIIAVGSTIGSLTVVTTRYAPPFWPDDIVSRLRLFGEVVANAIMRKQSEESLRKALSELRQLKEQIEADYTYLRKEIEIGHDFREVVGNSPALKQILVKIRQVAPTNATVLLQGETGTGKGHLAGVIHNLSPRKTRPLVQVNCAALSPTLIESELFGHEKGAFTSAHARKIGRFELARGTTLFLDEIGEFPMELQAKLLHVLQDGEFERVGGTTTIKTDARVIAATNKDLSDAVEKGRFRSDLWYRLSVFPVTIPPLRERLEDIPLFLDAFVKKYEKEMGKRFNKIPHAALDTLKDYSWPGNIRELQNLIERALITSRGNILHIEMPSHDPLNTKTVDKTKPLAQFEREYILEVLEDCGWKIQGPNGAANRLNLHPATLRSRMKKLGIYRQTSFSSIAPEPALQKRSR